MSDRPLLMIPGPIEISPAVQAATGIAPPSHVSPAFIEGFGSALASMRAVWQADDRALPFAVPGGGTLAMEAAATNLVAPGERAVVASTGYFGDRMAEMLRRRGADVVLVPSAIGDAPTLAAVGQALATAPTKALFVTHVDTSTGVCVDPAPLAALAREHGALSCFDGVCATAGETFDMAGWGADVYLTASQKAIGLPAGLALWVASERALAAREALSVPPPLTLDWQAWRPIMEAYLAGKPSYFSTPPTTLAWALRTGLDEILAGGATPAAAMQARFALHSRSAEAMRAGWTALGLTAVPVTRQQTAHTLSALWLPDGADASLPSRIAAHGVIVAGGLHPEIRTRYFRVGHMGDVLNHPDRLLTTVRAVGLGLRDAGVTVDVDGAVAATAERLGAA
ncbi:MAG: alanine--glyoxylate aminotransferase family protein [Alphaproteobacteria bacterium]|nr:alanine--glyoxylate aminotransferase family protein [Alphaproteobacteria bacterium]